jgi:hypothetical protein
MDAARDPLVGKKHKHQIRQRVNDLGRVGGGIVVLEMRVSKGITVLSCQLLASSHQFIVDVAAPQYPSPDGGYGKDGK